MLVRTTVGSGVQSALLGDECRVHDDEADSRAQPSLGLALLPGEGQAFPSAEMVGAIAPRYRKGKKENLRFTHG
jgi:hypothetical protein